MDLTAIEMDKHSAHYDTRCTCGRLLFRGNLMPGSKVEIRCPKCSKLFVAEKQLIPGYKELIALAELAGSNGQDAKTIIRKALEDAKRNEVE